MRKGKLTYAAPEEVEYEMPSASSMFTDTMNMIPMVGNIKGARALMGAKYSVGEYSIILIYRSNGEVFYGPIKDYVFCSGDRGLSVDPTTKKIVWFPVSGVSRHQFRDKFYRVNLKSGRSVDATEHHSFVTMGENGELVEIEPEKMKRFCPVPLAGKIEVETLFDDFIIPDGNKHNARHGRSIPLDFDFGWLVGLYLSEGSINKRKEGDIKKTTGITWAALDIGVNKRGCDILETIGVDAGLQRNQNRYEDGRPYAFVANWSQLGIKFEQEFGNGSDNKFIPGWAFFTSESFRSGIISGYLAGDGGFATKGDRSLKITASTNSIQLRDGLCMLLSTLGIFSTVSQAFYLGKDRYKLNICKQDIGLLPAIYHSEKDEKIAQYVEPIHRGKDWIPKYTKLRDYILAAIQKGTTERNYWRRDDLNKRLLLKLFGNKTEDICPWATSDVVWDYVTSVDELEQKERTVYDLHMDDNLFMTGTGVFVHNTTQALPLVVSEAPLVDSEDEETGEFYGRKLGNKIGMVASPYDGVVHKIKNDVIELKDAAGQTKEIPLRYFYGHNKKTYTTDTPLVKVGEQVKAGQHVAHSNYVTPEGDLAFGANLRVAYMPGHGGKTFEDAIMVSESAAKRLTSSHLYNFTVDNKLGIQSDKRKFIQLFPNKYTKDQLDKIDDNGIVKSGAELNAGDPVFLSFAPRTLKAADKAKGNLHKIIKNSFIDSSQTWEKAHPGKAIDAIMNRSGYSVNVTTSVPMQFADKLSTRFANKGVCAVITPDDQMFKDKEGNTVDVLINPASVIGRVNPGSVFEAMLGKIAAKTGKRYKMPSFSEDSTLDYVKKELADNQISDTEDLYDPITERMVPGVLTGNQYVMKLEHQAGDKWSAVDEAASDQNGQPGKPGGHDSCFPADQKVRTITGEVEIGKICEKRISIPVLTYSEDQQEWCYRPIIDWFVYEKPIEDILTIKVLGPVSPSASPKRMTRFIQALYPTKNHNVEKWGKGLVRADSLSIGDCLVGPGVWPTKDQESLIYGTMLGDGYIHKDSSIFYDSHIQQSEYLKWKQSHLCGLGAYISTTDRTYLSSYNSGQTKTVDTLQILQPVEFLDQVREICYKNENRSVVSKEWLDRVGDVGIVAWILDDGCITNSSKKKWKTKLSGCIATNNFEESSVWLLSEFLNKRFSKQGLFPIRETKNGHVIGLNKQECLLLIELIALHIPAKSIPASKRFLVKAVEDLQMAGAPLVNLDTQNKLTKVPLRITSIENIFRGAKDGVKTIKVYDFTVEETHRYCAGSALVSNSKRIGYLDVLALLSHGAKENLADIQQYRSGSNQDMWRRIRMGQPLPAPEVPFIYDKFISTLKGAGINTEKKGSKIFIKALKKKDIDELTGDREIQNSETIDPITKEPVKGGLMDMALHGIDGKRWSYIKLDEKVPNPILEEPFRKILGITKQKMLDVLAGKDQLEGRTGAQALYDAYHLLDKGKLEEDLKSTVRNGRKTARDVALKRLNALSGLKQQGIEADDLFMDKVPVLPSSFRPVSAFGKLMLSADPNYLYKDLMTARDLHRSTTQELGKDEAGEEAVSMYHALAAVQGLGDPIHPKTAQKGVKGFIRSLSAGGPKCYDDATEILTENGWISFPEYNDSSIQVATLNPDSKEMEFQNPSDIIHEDYHGAMIHTKTQKLDLFVTENHQHYVHQIIKRGYTEGGKKKRYRELQDACKINARDLCGKTARVLYVTAAENFSGSTPEYKFDGKKVDKESFAKFVGWWVAEGWATFYLGEARSVVMAQKTGSIGEATIDGFMSTLGIPFNRSITTKCVDSKFSKAGYQTTVWSINSRELSAWMVKNCGSGSHNKKLSKEILEWNKNDQLTLLKGYLRGDGERVVKVDGEKKTYQNMSEVVNEGSRFSTTSRDLVDCIERLCLQCGLGFNRQGELHEDHEVWAKQYRCSIYGWNKVMVEYKDQTQRIENYSGRVHCVTVPNGLVFVRRNKKIAISGNCGMFLSKVVGHTVNTVGRGVVVPDSELDMDTIGVPENIAWKLYAPFVMRRMVKAGMPAQNAALNIERRTDFSKKFLLQEMNERPVLYNRAPSLHKFNVMASKPHLVTGDGIHISPLAIKPMNMDFDGDAINIHVPISDGAVKEANNKLMPSQNLFDIKQRRVHYTPSQEFTLGIWSASAPNKTKAPVKYKKVEDALQAYKNGEIDIDTPVEIG